MISEKQKGDHHKTANELGFTLLQSNTVTDDDELQLKLSIQPPLRNNKGAASLNNRLYAIK